MDGLSSGDGHGGISPTDFELLGLKEPPSQTVFPAHLAVDRATGEVLPLPNRSNSLTVPLIFLPHPEQMEFDSTKPMPVCANNGIDVLPEGWTVSDLPAPNDPASIPPQIVNRPGSFTCARPVPRASSFNRVPTLSAGDDGTIR